MSIMTMTQNCGIGDSEWYKYRLMAVIQIQNGSNIDSKWW